MTDCRAFLLDLFHEAVAAADPARVVAAALPDPPTGRTVVVGAGKASAAMAEALEAAWPGPLEGLVVTRYGHAAPCRRIEVVEASHPVPDEAGARAAARMLALVGGLGADDLVIALISGGGSALLSLPPDEVGAEAKREVNAALLASGAPIGEMNTVRKHLSLVKGGRLAAAAAPAKVVTLVVSDIPGDEASLVASGPTVPDARGRKEALAIVRRYDMRLPERAMAWLQSSACTAPSPRDPAFAHNEVRLVANAQMSLEAAAAAARARGFPARILSDALQGEAREAGRAHAAVARQVRTRGQPFRSPVVLLSGGETTVTLSADGRRCGKGGRNTEFLLGFALGVDGLDGVWALAADTDGIDGSQENAGAWADGSTVARLRDRGLDARDLLARNDAYTAFAALGDLVVTGPTRTNVNDFRAVMISEAD